MAQDNGMQKYLFKGDAAALRGTIRKPYFQKLGDHAVVSTYAGSAGQGSASNRNFSVGGSSNTDADKGGGDDLAYDAVTSEISAQYDGATYNTVIVSTIEKLSVGGGWLTADLVVGRLESRYNPREYPARTVARILPAGSRFVNLAVNHQPVNPDLPPAFTLSEDEQEAFFDGKYDDDPRFHPGFFTRPLYLEGFGTVFIAEWTWVHPTEQYEQHLTMLRLALGSTLGGQVECSTTHVDGRGWPS